MYSIYVVSGDKKRLDKENVQEDFPAKGKELEEEYSLNTWPADPTPEKGKSKAQNNKRKASKSSDTSRSSKR